MPAVAENFKPSENLVCYWTMMDMENLTRRHYMTIHLELSTTDWILSNVPNHKVR